MVYDHVEKNADVVLIRFTDQATKVSHSPELGIDGVVVGHVVAKIDEWGREQGVIQGIHSSILKVVKARRNAIEIADSIAICILKTARIDFIEHRASTRDQ